MRICIVVPTERYLDNAGTRIRYQRIRGPLSSAGHEVSILPIHTFSKLDHDVYLFSKCYEATSQLMARMAARAGKIVGVDLFDDYFSQYDNGQIQRFRNWLKEFLPSADFVLCSTPIFVDIVRDYAPELPVHIMGDPFDKFDIEGLRRALNTKHSDLSATGMLKVAWYGRGDNTIFPVGLADLTAFAPHLSALQKLGFTVRLEIMTDSQSMTGDALASLSSLPILFELHEWSEVAEQSLLSRSHVAFLPVSAQNFSIAKSLNRCITALSAGCQILSVGYPLYETFDEIIYRDAYTLGEDLNRKQPRLRLETLKTLERLLHTHADPIAGANKLAAFLDTIASNKIAKPQPRSKDGPVMLFLHGLGSTGLIHKFVRRQDGFSVASPFATGGLNYDIRFVWNDECTGLNVLLSEGARNSLPESLRRQCTKYGLINEYTFYAITQAQLPELALNVAFLGKSVSPSGKYAAYPEVMKVMKTVVEMLFPKSLCVVSELSRTAQRATVENIIEVREFQ